MAEKWLLKEKLPKQESSSGKNNKDTEGDVDMD